MTAKGMLNDSLLSINTMHTAVFKLIGCLFILLLSSASVDGQSATHFNVAHDLHSINETTYSVLTTDSGYVASCGYTDSLAPIGTEFIVLDIFGNVVSRKIVAAPNRYYYPGYCNSMTRTSDGGYALAGGFIDSVRPQMLLIKYTAYGDTVWTRTYVNDSATVGYQCKQTVDGGYVLVGTSQEFDPWVDVIVIRTDSLGNELWRKYYGGNNSDYGISIITTPDNGFLIGSESNSFGGDYDSYVIKTDSLGNVEWTKILGGNLDETGPQLAVDYDGNYIVGSNDTYLQPFGPGQGNPSSKLAVAKLDPTGNLLWQKDYGAVRQQTAIRSIRVNSNNTIVCAANTSNMSVVYGCILEVTAGGDSTRMRLYTNNSHPLNAINSLDSTADGGYIMAGLTQAQNNAQCWFVKVDSLLCDVAGCDAVNIDETNTNENIPVSVTVFPNPANEVVNIKTVVPINNGVLTVMNHLGQTIIELAPNSDVIALNTSSLPTGFYIFILKNEKVTITGNFQIVR